MVERTSDLHELEVSGVLVHDGWVTPEISEVTWYDSTGQLISFVVNSFSS